MYQEDLQRPGDYAVKKARVEHLYAIADGEVVPEPSYFATEAPAAFVRVGFAAAADHAELGEGIRRLGGAAG